MRRLLVLAGLAGAAWWLVRRRTADQPRAVIGYADDSSIPLDAGSPHLDRLVAAARSVIGP
jgi:hypothetical protein